MAREWGIQPSEFWRMSAAEYWAEFDTKIEQAERLEEMQAKAAGKPGKASKKDWARALAEHDKKMGRQ